MSHQRIGSVILFLALASCGGKAAERPAAAGDSTPMAPATTRRDEAGGNGDATRTAGPPGLIGPESEHGAEDRVSVALSTAGGAKLDRLVARHVDQLRRLSAVYETKVATMK